MEQPFSHWGEPASPTTPSQALRRISIVLYGVVIAVCVVVLLARSRLSDLAPELSLFVLVALGFLILLHTRFLSLARKGYRQTAGALQVSEREFQSIFENALDGILVLDDQAICLGANPAALRLFGVTLEQLLGKPVLVHFADAGAFQNLWNGLLQRNQELGIAELRRTDASVVFVEFSGTAEFLPGRHLVILRDITARRRSETALLASEERLRQMADNIQEIFWMLDTATRKVIYVNRAYETITCHSREAILENLSFAQGLIYPDDRDHVLARLEETTENGKVDERFRILSPGGKVRWIWLRGVPVRDSGGGIRRFVGTALDITAQKEAEEEVANNLTLAKSAWAEADALRGATLALTQELHMDYVLDTLLESLLQLVPYHLAQVLLLEADTRIFLAREALRLDTGKQFPKYPLTLNAAEYPVIRRVLASQHSVLLSDTRQEKEWREFNGHINLRSWFGVPLIAAHRTLGLLAVGHSLPNTFTQEHLGVTKSLAVAAAAAIQNARLYERAEIYGAELERRLSDLHAAQKALEQSEERRRASEETFKKVFRSSPIAFSITTLADGRILDVNEAFERRFGYSREELLGRLSTEVGFWENPAERLELVDQLRQEQVIRNRVTRFRSKSSVLMASTYSVETIQIEGQPCLLFVSNDISLSP